MDHKERKKCIKSISKKLLLNHIEALHLRYEICNTLNNIDDINYCNIKYISEHIEQFKIYNEELEKNYKCSEASLYSLMWYF